MTFGCDKRKLKITHRIFFSEEMSREISLSQFKERRAAQRAAQQAPPVTHTPSYVSLPSSAALSPVPTSLSVPPALPKVAPSPRTPQPQYPSQTPSQGPTAVRLIRPLENRNQDTKSWLTNLQRFVYDRITPLFAKTEEERVKAVGPEAMAIWAKTFTHESFNPETGANYEELEKLGDIVMKAAFITYLQYNTERFGILNRGQLSELSNHYMAREEQSLIARDLGLSRFLRSAIPPNLAVQEDLLEALFGAMLLIGNSQVFNPSRGAGRGTEFVYNAIVNIYSKVAIDMRYTKGHAKTQVTQIFRRLNWGNIIEENDEVSEDEFTSVSVTTLRFTPRAIDYLKRNRIPFQSDVLASERGSTKLVSSNRAYSTALRVLEEMGLSKAEVSKIRAEIEISDPVIAPLYQQALNKAVSEGYADILLKRLRTEKGFETYGLYLILPEPNTEEEKVIQQLPEEVISSPPTQQRLLAAEKSPTPPIGSQPLAVRIKAASFAKASTEQAAKKAVLENYLNPVPPGPANPYRQ